MREGERDIERLKENGCFELVCLLIMPSTFFLFSLEFYLHDRKKITLKK